jgi:hypothetical protein
VAPPEHPAPRRSGRIRGRNQAALDGEAAAVAAHVQVRTHRAMFNTLLECWVQQINPWTVHDSAHVEGCCRLAIASFSSHCQLSYSLCGRSHAACMLRNAMGQFFPVSEATAYLHANMPRCSP